MMYVPKHFEPPNAESIHGLIRDYPLATLVVNTDSGLCANHIPMIIDQTATGQLRLHGHIARANSLSQREVQEEALAIFQGPNAYISPNWYATKKQHGKVVPTWNYSTVHATGQLRIIDDPEWVMDLITRLTNKEEADQPTPWAVTDAPVEFTEGLLSAIVGVELAVTQLTGKWKVSQNQPKENHDGVRLGLLSTSNPNADRLIG